MGIWGSLGCCGPSGDLVHPRALGFPGESRGTQGCWGPPGAPPAVGVPLGVWGHPRDLDPLEGLGHTQGVGVPLGIWGTPRYWVPQRVQDRVLGFPGKSGVTPGCWGPPGALQCVGVPLWVGAPQGAGILKRVWGTSGIWGSLKDLRHPRDLSAPEVWGRVLGSLRGSWAPQVLGLL